MNGDYRLRVWTDEITQNIRYNISNLYEPGTKKLASGGFTTEDPNEFIGGIIELLRIPLKDKKICPYCQTKLL